MKSRVITLKEITVTDLTPKSSTKAKEIFQKVNKEVTVIVYMCNS